MGNEAKPPGPLAAGKAGYMACHIIKELLARGYHVRGTVRDAGNKAKTSFLWDMAVGSPGTLELFSADLGRPGSFDEPIMGCSYVCHLATPVALKSKHAQRDIVDPAVHGTNNVFEAILKARCATRVVVTSSVTTCFSDDDNVEHEYTEADWNEDATVKDTPYPLAKVLAERAAWKFYNDQPKAGTWRFELVTMLPGVALGPVLAKGHLSTSPQIVQQLLNGSLPMAPDIELGLVDVRDAAAAHVAALEDPSAHGRYILVAEDWTFLEMAKVLRRAFGNKYRVPKREAPHCLLYLIALFHAQASWEFLRRHLGVRIRVSSARAREELGVRFRPAEESVLDTARSLVNANWVHAKA
eukprot:SM000116S24236  [mRNA]  locus=s116:211028:214105:+ [translate_table: standard]